MGIHGKKFTMTDTCDKLFAKIFITIYQTGKVLIQGEGKRHSLNLPFVSHHLEELCLKVYNRRLQSSKTPFTKPVSHSKSISKTYVCHKCNHKFTDVLTFYSHKRREHGQLKRMALDSVLPTSSSITPASKSLAKSHPALKVDTLVPLSLDKPQLTTALLGHSGQICTVVTM